MHRERETEREREREREIHVSGPLLLYSSVIEKEYEEMYVYARLNKCGRRSAASFSKLNFTIRTKLNQN